MPTFKMKIQLHQSPAWKLLMVFCCLKFWKAICSLDPSLYLQLSLLTIPSLSKQKHKELLGSCSKRHFFFLTESFAHLKQPYPSVTLTVQGRGTPVPSIPLLIFVLIPPPYIQWPCVQSIFRAEIPTGRDDVLLVITSSEATIFGN